MGVDRADIVALYLSQCSYLVYICRKGRHKKCMAVVVGHVQYEELVQPKEDAEN